MGLFVVPKNGNDATAEQEVEAVIANLELWQQHRDLDYLLDFAAIGISRAIEKENDATLPRL